MALHLALDDFGDENLAALRTPGNNQTRWRFIAELAKSFDLTAIQLGRLYTAELGMNLEEIPEYITCKFHLNYHPAGPASVYSLGDEREETQLWECLGESLKVAQKHRICDVSIHPPLATGSGGRGAVATATLDRLARVLSHWLPLYAEAGVKLSIESHIAPGVFALSGPDEFRAFVSSFPGLGVLVDVAHVHNDEHDPVSFIELLPKGTITGLHLSDALAGVPHDQGTHLPVGEGEVDFPGILELFDGVDPVHAALEIKGPARAVAESVTRLRRLGYP